LKALLNRKGEKCLMIYLFLKQSIIVKGEKCYQQSRCKKGEIFYVFQIEFIHSIVWEDFYWFEINPLRSVSCVWIMSCNDELKQKDENCISVYDFLTIQTRIQIYFLYWLMTSPLLRYQHPFSLLSHPIMNDFLISFISWQESKSIK
jgi:hypothetical protein